MTQIIQLDKYELKEIISEIVKEALNSLKTESKIQTEEDKITDLDEVQKITGMKKSVIYKLTAANEIPVKRFGKKLVFSRKDLLEWVNSKTIKTESLGISMSKQIQLAARRKLK